MDELQEKGPSNIIVAIIGNKADLSNEVVSTSEAQGYAEKHNAIFM
jgi:hypothetical protein